VSGKFIVGLDIGTTKVCAVVGHARKGERPEIVGVGLVPSNGVERGTVVDMGATADAIRCAVDEAELTSGIEVRAAYAGIAGAHVGCIESYGATGIKGRSVTRDDRQRVIDSASAVHIPLDRSVLHVLPMEFIIDGQNAIMDPLGMSGVRLEANVCVVTASISAMENLARCCEMAGVGVIDTVFEPLASSRSVLDPGELRAGVAVMDMGGGTTDVAVFRGGGLRHASVLPVGGRHFTHDLAIGLRIPEAEAERIKKQYGYALGGSKCPRTVEVNDADGQLRDINREGLWEIILPRTEEVFELIGEEIQDVLRYSPSSTVVLTGGAALLEGIERVAEARLGIPARLGLPATMADAGLDTTYVSPVCSTAVGLMLYGVEAERGMYSEFFEGMRGRLRQLGRGLLGLRQRALGLLNL
jgi:cell division protein FtsA